MRRVESFATDAAVPALWLYTVESEAFSIPLGWERAGIETERDHDVVLMRRDL